MWHWVEWEKANKHKINNADELIDIQTTVLQYIKQLESDKEKLIEKLEKTIDDDENSDTEYQIRRKFAEEILKIVKGGKE